ncbi:unnamed protein product [Nippostrongylus brasiliensis]|uniref:Uncharacterized protein n=1 Tax=Nippostrongylus brasiliensis TaxID=27835 RepID=A0A0N4Y548_NIPBR|nr:unnamed protein product [Nippostrongylus brasiliensis]
MLAHVQFLQSKDLQTCSSTKLRSHGQEEVGVGIWEVRSGRSSFICGQQAQLQSNESDWVFIPFGSHEGELFHHGIPSEFRVNAIAISEISATFLLS